MKRKNENPENEIVAEGYVMAGPKFLALRLMDIFTLVGPEEEDRIRHNESLRDLKVLAGDKMDVFMMDTAKNLINIVIQRRQTNG